MSTAEIDTLTDDATSQLTRRSRTVRRLTGLGWVVCAAFSLWCVAAILLGGTGPEGIGGTRWTFAVLFAASTVAAPSWLGSRRGVGAVALLGLSVLGWFTTLQPSNDRDWPTDQRRLPWAEIDGPVVVIHNIRDFRYRSTTDWDEGWYDASYDSRELQGVDFFTVHFSTRTEIGHTMLSFRFNGDRFVTFSVEIRREIGEEYGLLRGLFRQFELTYVVGDERDLVQLRTNHRRSQVFLHPTKANRGRQAALFLELVGRLNRLSEAPVFYNTLTNNCTTNLVRHWEQITSMTLPLDLRWVLSGYADEFAYDLGLLDTAIGFQATRLRNLVSDKALACGGARDFSLCVRR